jgi:phosphatidylglycerophosphatase A
VGILPPKVRRALAVAVGTGLGAGYAPAAPGTVGSALGLVVFAALAPGGWRLTLGAAAALLFAGAWAARECGALFGAHDHRRIVVDEVVGQLVALSTFPARLPWLLAGFALFRLFDIVKPWPAGLIDRRWSSAAGVMADDLVAGLYANLVLQAARALWWPA